LGSAIIGGAIGRRRTAENDEAVSIQPDAPG
jgi:hypothetical protein